MPSVGPSGTSTSWAWSSFLRYTIRREILMKKPIRPMIAFQSPPASTLDNHSERAAGEQTEVPYHDEEREYESCHRSDNCRATRNSFPQNGHNKCAKNGSNYLREERTAQLEQSFKSTVVSPRKCRHAKPMLAGLLSKRSTAAVRRPRAQYDHKGISFSFSLYPPCLNIDLSSLKRRTKNETRKTAVPSCHGMATC